MGRHVATLHDGRLARGRQELFWDGKTSEGRAAPSGMYFVRLVGDGVKASAAVTLVR